METQQKSVLIIEDETSLRQALYDKFFHAGYRVLTAVDGEEGLKMAIEQKPTCILLDILMPKMDGLTMLRKLREVDNGKKIPVILLSNLSEAKDISEALALGAHDYLVKSAWKIEDVVKKVEEKTLA